MRHSAFSIMVDSVNFTSRTQLRWQTPDLPNFGSYQPVLLTCGRFWSRIRTSCSKELIWRQTPIGAWTRNERPGFSLSTAVPAPDQFDVFKGDAFFAKSDCVDMHAGTVGMVGLVAYTGGAVVPNLLQRPGQPDPRDDERLREVQGPNSLAEEASPTGECMETTQ